MRPSLHPALVHGLGFDAAAAAKATHTLGRQLPRRLVADLAGEQALSTCGALRARLGLSDEELRTVIARRPALLGLSYSERLGPTMAGLGHRLGEDRLRAMALRLPAVLGTSFESCQRPKLDFLQRSLRLSDDELSRAVSAAPIVLFLGSLERSLRPNLALWRRALRAEGLGVADELVHSEGAVGVGALAYSHDGWVRPRLRRARRANVAASAVLRALPKTDAGFAAWLELEEGREVGRGVGRRGSKCALAENRLCGPVRSK